MLHWVKQRGDFGWFITPHAGQNLHFSQHTAGVNELNEERVMGDPSQAVGAVSADLPRLIVGMGASAGGLQALEEFFQTLQPPTGMAFVVVQHLSPHFKSLMDELLGRHSQLRVIRAENDTHLRADHVYLMPPGVEMILSGDALLLSEKDPKSRFSFPIDQFFRTLAQEQRERAVAIVLSGTGSDGSRGVVDVHNAGGLVLVQQEDSAKFTGMPHNAIQSGVVRHTVRPREMPELLRAHLRNAEQPVDPQAASQKAPGGGIKEIFNLLKSDFQIDFSMYRPTTIARRIQRRLLMTPGMTLDGYAQALAGDPAERQALYHDLLIGVTSFFRDDEAFLRLQREVLPELLDKLDEGEEFRAWVAGCASGEEVYSLAILVDEVLARMNKSVSVKIFATDVHRPSLEIASSGSYSPESLAGVSQQRLGRYFRFDKGRYQASPRLREMLIFAPHNLLRDSPFTRLHLVCCRNLLIYFQAVAQQKALSLFHFSLLTGGVLFLGASESLGEYADEFDAVDDHWRIYRKRRDVRLHSTSEPLRVIGDGLRQLGIATQSPRSTSSAQGLFEKILGETLPPSILIDESRQLLHSFGSAGRYLEMKSGRPSLDILDMLGGDMKMLLASGIQRAQRRGKPVMLANVRWKCAETDQLLDVVVRPFQHSGCSVLLISFQESASPRPGKDRAEAGSEAEITAIQASRDRVETLERELRNMHENLQITVEELETSNEELEASNEELLAANEELQSTNEELQSVNEELFTVNTEHQKKIEELRLANRDVENLFLSTETHTLFLDEKLAIRKFTPRMAEVFNLIPGDVGRRIDSFVHTIECPDLQAKLRRALETGERFEEEIDDSNGMTYLMRIFSYDEEQPRAGVVFTLVDVTRLKHAERQFRVAVETAPGAIMMVDRDGIIRLANTLSETMFGYRSDELIGKRVEVLIPQRFHRRHRVLQQQYFADPQLRPMGAGRQLSGLRKSGEEFPLDIQLSPLDTPDGSFVLAAAIDLSETKRLERSLRDQVENRDLFLAMLSHELRNPLGAALNAATILDRIADAEMPQRELIGLIVGQTRQMSRLLDDLLDVSRVAQGKIQLKRQPCDLAELMREAVTVTQYQLGGRHQQLRVQLPDAPCWVDGDRGRLLQVFENLLTNASKYTQDHGRIQVTLQAAHGQAKLAVSDNGRGIPDDKLETIFDMFAQCENSIDRQDAGMGVGLTLVRSIIQMHGGSVVAHSGGLGQGSEFAVTLPLGQAPTPQSVVPKPHLDAVRPGQVVLVEDNEESRRTLQMLLQLEGFEVEAAGDGQAGLELICKVKPAVAILDIGLPLIDGYQLAQRLREDFPPQQLHLIALTGYGRTEDRQAVQQAGFDSHLVKPVQINQLLDALGRACLT